MAKGVFASHKSKNFMTFVRTSTTQNVKRMEKVTSSKSFYEVNVTKLSTTFRRIGKKCTHLNLIVLYYLWKIIAIRIVIK